MTKSAKTYSGQVNQTMQKWFNYDHAGRLEKVEQEITGDTDNGKVVLAQNDYNELGQLILKKLHSQAGKSFAQDVDYSYNVQGWLTGINHLQDASVRKLFAQEMGYKPNGNIGSVQWKNTLLDANNQPAASYEQSFTFSYDGLNRLLSADYSDTDPATQANFSSSYSYYPNGNFHTLSRYGNKNDALSAASYDLIDNLTYNYPDYSNQVSSVSDGVSTGVSNPHQYAYNTGTYLYDKNGNATKIADKNLDVAYNFLNLPKTIGSISYLYDASGNKLKKTFGTNVSLYQGSVLKVNADQLIVLTGEGRAVQYQGGVWAYEYDLKDHLGNTRVSFAANEAQAQPLQYKDYYPFGLEMDYGIANNADATKYLYNGKELQDEGGLDFYDYGARFYDPAIGRWHTPDIMSESFFRHSPYSYSFNNPIKYYDPNGMWPKSIHNIMLSNIGNLMTKDDLSTLMRASKEADAQKYQSPELSYRHAMGQKLLNDNESIRLYNNFISDQFGKALNAKSRSKGLEELGMALHAIMDNSSPTHKGFQVWKGIKEEENFGATHWLGEQDGAYFDPINRADIILAIQEMETLYESFDQAYGKSNLIDEVTVTAKKTEGSKSLDLRVEDMLWEFVRPNTNGNTGRYNKPGRSSDQNYSDDFLKWYYDK